MAWFDLWKQEPYTITPDGQQVPYDPTPPDGSWNVDPVVPIYRRAGGWLLLAVVAVVAVVAVSTASKAKAVFTR